MENTQLTSAKEYNPKERMVFSEPKIGNVPDSKLTYMRVSISSRNLDGTVGELIIPTTRLYSFGVCENTSQETGKVTGYTLPLCLWNRDGPTKEEKAWTDTFDAIIECCIDYIMENKNELGLFEATRSDFTKSKGGLNPLYWKMESLKDDKGKTLPPTRVKGRGPTLYPKLIFSKKHNKFLSQFFDTNDKPLDVREDLMGDKHVYATAAIKIESIFVGSRIAVQVKVYEAVTEPANSGMKRLLRPKATSQLIQHSRDQESTSSNTLSSVTSTNEDEGSLNDEDETNEDEVDIPPSVEAPKPKKTVKRTVKKVVQKA